MYLLVMSPSQSGLSWRIFSSARDLFHFSSKSKISIENEPKFDSQLKIYYFWLILIINLYWKWLNYADKSYYSTPFVLKNSNKWSWNWLESYYWSKNGKLDLRFFDIHIVGTYLCKEKGHFLIYFIRAYTSLYGKPIVTI